MREQGAQRFGITSRGNHASRAQKLGNLGRQLAGYSCRAEDQDILAGRQFCAGSKRQPGRDAGIHDGGCGFIAQNMWNREGENASNNGAFGHCAIRRARSAEEHAASVVQMPHSIDAADHGQGLRTGVMAAAGQLLIDRLQCRRMNMYDHLAVARDWFIERLISGRLSQSV